MPGTTIAVTLLPGFVEIRDKGIVKKKILTKNKSFDIVLEEVKLFFRYKGKILPPGVLKDVLIKIGLPQVKMIIDEKDLEVETPVEEPSPKPTTPSTPSAYEQKTPERPPKIEPAETEVTVTLGDKEITDIEEALSIVESLSDTFLASKPVEEEVGEKTEQPKPKIVIDVKGSDEISAALTSQATKPEIPVHDVDPSILIDDSETISEIEVSPDVDEPEAVPPIVKTESQIHLVKPLIETKAIILGEEDVGKACLMQKANLSGVLTEDLSSPFIHEKVFELADYRVKLHVWSFDEASAVKIPRREFYENAGAVIIVYSAADRWSFQSIDFWLKETTVTTDIVPPIIIVGNKIDLRELRRESSGEKPVTKDEGFKLAEELAKSHGVDGKLHPVAFIEASCKTGEGVEAVFKTVAELSLRRLT